MKKFFENTFVLISEIIALAISIYSCIKEPDFKSIGGIGISFIALVVTVFFKLKKDDPEKSLNKNVIKVNNIESSTIIQDVSGTVNINTQHKRDETN